MPETTNYSYEEFSKATRTLLEAHAGDLLSLARASIAAGLETRRPLDPDLTTLAPELSAPGATFVTLKTNGATKAKLRGCIGTVTAHQALAVDVCQNAFRSAFSDPRFPPLRMDETNDDFRLSISLLSPATPMQVSDEQDLLDQLKPGTDGLIIEDGHNRALFLPSVWEQLPEPAEFLAHLKAKAGMAPDHWSPTFRAQRFIAAEAKADWNEIKALD